MRHHLGGSYTAFSLLAVAIGYPTSLSGQRSPAAVGPPLSEQALRRRVFDLAADFMRGRAAGSRENNIATEYIARVFSGAGLRPGGENGTWFQTVPLSRRVLDSAATSISVDGRRLTLGEDFLPRDVGSRARDFDRATVIYGGQWEDSTRTLPSASSAGKIVVVTSAKPMIDHGRALRRFGSAAAICIVDLDALSPALRSTIARFDAVIRLDTTGDSRPSPSVLHLTRSTAELLLGAPLDRITPGDSGGTLGGAIRYRTIATPARNVVAILPGRTSARSQYVIVGAHNDHLGVTRFVADADSVRAFNRALRRSIIAAANEPSPTDIARLAADIRVNMDSIRKIQPIPRLDSIYNGADDDASGTAALLEIARAMAAAPVRPARSIAFISHTAEEMGDIGSQWYASHPTIPRDSIVAMINLDMIGRGAATDERGGGPNYLALVGARRLSSELDDLIRRVSREHRYDWAFDSTYDQSGHPEQVYCRSENASYAQFGIPVAFLFTGYHADYHQLTDEPEYLDYRKLTKVARFTRDVIETIGNIDHRLTIDRPVSAPGTPCRQ